MKSLLRFQDTRAVFITAAHVLDPIGTFLRVERPSSRRILLQGNDLSLAAAILSAWEGVPPNAVSQEAGTSAH